MQHTEVYLQYEQYVHIYDTKITGICIPGISSCACSDV